MKKQRAVGMTVWTMILAVVAGTAVLQTALSAPAPVPAVVGDWSGAVITFKDPNLHFESESIGGVYDGKISKDNSEIAGEWKQSGVTAPLTFKRAAKNGSKDVRK